MPFPWLAAGSLAAGPILNKVFPSAFGGKQGYNVTDPETYKGDVTIDEGELGQMRQGILSNIQTTVTEPGIRSVKQAGAAKGMPLGSIASATRGVTTAGAKEARKAEPGLQDLKRRSMLDFIQMKNKYEYDKNMFDFAQGQNDAAMNQGALGGLSRLFMLWNAGALDKPPTAGVDVSV